MSFLQIMHSNLCSTCYYWSYF